MYINIFKLYYNCLIRLAKACPSRVSASLSAMSPKYIHNTPVYKTIYLVQFRNLINNVIFKMIS